jgi:nucleoside phosphorylase
MKRNRTDISELKSKVDFGIITIREDEFEAILQRLPTEELVTGSQTYAISRLKTVNEDEYVIASVRCPEQGNAQGQSVASRLISELQPQWILLVGIAGSVPSEEYTLGDVLLASRLHDFSVSASIEGKEETRQEFASRGGPMHPQVQSLVAALQALTPFLEPWNTPESIGVARPQVNIKPSTLYGDAKWKRNVREALEIYFGEGSIRQQPKAFTGSIASSDVLVKDTQLVSQWLSSARQVKGVEMELAGVYQAAWDAQKPVLAIRGISDIVGVKRSPAWTSYACHTAAAFAVALLHYRPIAPLSAQESEPTPLEGGEGASLSSSLNQPVGVFKSTPPTVEPVLKSERLYSNLLELAYFPEKLYSVQTDCINRNEVWAILKEQVESPPNDWIMKGQMLYAFHDFSDPMWENVCHVNTVEIHNTTHWSKSTNHDRIAEFIELLKGCLREFGLIRNLNYIHRQTVGGEKKTFKYLYFAPTSEFMGSPFLRADDLIDAGSLIKSLKDKQTPIAKYLLSRLPTETRKLIRQYPPIPKTLVPALVKGLNQVLRDDLYKPSLFEGIFLRKEVNVLLEKDSLKDKELANLNRILLEDAYPKDIARRYLAPRTVTMKSLIQTRSRDVFKPYFSKKTGKLSYYRHSAFRSEFVRFDNQWYLEITPTHHYTWNGFRVSRFYEDLLKGMKRLEKNESVFRQVLFLSRVLTDETAKADGQDYPYLIFGKLLDFSFIYGLKDELWMNKESLEKADKAEKLSASRRRGRPSRGRGRGRS